MIISKLNFIHRYFLIAFQVNVEKVDSLHIDEGPMMRKALPFDVVIMDFVCVFVSVTSGFHILSWSRHHFTARTKPKLDLLYIIAQDDVDLRITSSVRSLRWASLWGVNNPLFTVYFKPMSQEKTILPDNKVHGANMGSIPGVNLGSTGSRWDPCWPHELCYLGYFVS